MRDAKSTTMTTTCEFPFLILKKKKKNPQHFYNKSQVVSCYWFKFETNTKITFLPQQ